MNNNDEEILRRLNDLDSTRLERKKWRPYLVPAFVSISWGFVLFMHKDNGPFLAYCFSIGALGALIGVENAVHNRQLDAIAALLTELTKESRMRKIREEYQASLQPQRGELSQPGVQPREPETPNSGAL